jgi:CheY-like chemotaxis protein
MSTSTPDTGSHRLRVAIADDDEGMRALLRLMLSFSPGIELVGEAVDGVEAVKLAERESPDVLLLDVQMPRLDGLDAAEIIQAFRPRTRVILHTASIERGARERARAAGVCLLEKHRFDDVVGEVLETEGAHPHEEPLRQIEAVVVTALQAARDQAVVVARPDGCVPFYNARAAAELGLPYPPRAAVRLDRLRDAYETLGEDGSPVPPERRPIARALREQRPISARLRVRRGCGEVRVYETEAIPFFDEHGDLLGAAHYFRRAA